MAQYTGVAVSPGRVIGTIRTMAPPVAEPAADATLPEGADAQAESERIPAAAAAGRVTAGPPSTADLEGERTCRRSTCW